MRLYAVDLLTMAALGAIGLGVYFADPAPTRSFAVDFSDGESECDGRERASREGEMMIRILILRYKVIYPQFAYPLRNEIVSSSKRSALRS